MTQPLNIFIIVLISLFSALICGICFVLCLRCLRWFRKDDREMIGKVKMRRSTVAVRTPADLTTSDGGTVTIQTPRGAKPPVPPPPLGAPHDPLPGEGKPRKSRLSLRLTPTRSAAHIDDVEIKTSRDSQPPPPLSSPDPVEPMLVGAGQRRSSRPPAVLRHIASEQHEALGEFSCLTPTSAAAPEWPAYTPEYGDGGECRL